MITGCVCIVYIIVYYVLGRHTYVRTYIFYKAHVLLCIPVIIVVYVALSQFLS